MAIGSGTAEHAASAVVQRCRDTHSVPGRLPTALQAAWDPLHVPRRTGASCWGKSHSPPTSGSRPAVPGAPTVPAQVACGECGVTGLRAV